MSILKKQETHCPDGIRHRWQYQIDFWEGKEIWVKVCRRCGQIIENKNAEVRYI